MAGIGLEYTNNPKETTIMPDKHGIESAIVLVKDKKLQGNLVSVLKEAGIGSVSTTEKTNKCLKEMAEDTEALLVLDWKIGKKNFVKVLEANKGRGRISVRPVFAIVPEMTNEIISTCYEYAIGRLYEVKDAADELKPLVDDFLRIINDFAKSREELTKVARSREKGDWNGANKILMGLIRQDPYNPRLASELAENLIHEGQWTQAEELIQPYTNLKPPFLRALHIYSRCLMRHGQYSQAVKLLEQAKVVNPHNVERLVDLGNALIRTDRIPEATRNFTQALEHDGKNRDATAGLGTCHLMLGEVNEALDLMSHTSSPREIASIFNTSAILSVRRSRYDKGMSLYRKALNIIDRDNKVSARLVFNMGIGYKRQDKLDQARECFQHAVKLDPSYTRARNLQVMIKQEIARPKGFSEARTGGFDPEYADIEDENISEADLTGKRSG